MLLFFMDILKEHRRLIYLFRTQPEPTIMTFGFFVPQAELQTRVLIAKTFTAPAAMFTFQTLDAWNNIWTF